MFNTKLEEKSYKMSLKFYRLKYSGQKSDRGRGAQCAPASNQIAKNNLRIDNVCIATKLLNYG